MSSASLVASASSSLRPPQRSDSFSQSERNILSAPVEVAYRLRLITGTASPGLAADVAQRLGTEVTKAKVGRFKNGEIEIEIHENVRGDDVYIIHSVTSTDSVDVNTALMELMLLIHTLRNSSARRITAVVPMFAYSRQDRKVDSRVPISASVVAQLIQAMGADRVMTLDLHCGQIQGFFRNMPMDNLQASIIFADYVKKQPWFDPERTVVVSPDAGGVERANTFADHIQASGIVTILKRRVEAGKVSSMQMVGDVRDLYVVIVDDMVDTGGTLIAACQLLKNKGGAKRIAVCATHGLLSKSACENLRDCDALDQLIVTDSIPQESHVRRMGPKLNVLSTAALLATAVSHVHNEESVSSLFPKNGTETKQFSRTKTPPASAVAGQSAFPLVPAAATAGQ